MCEVAICVKDMGKSGQLGIDSHAPQRGDVVEVQPDGFGWGACELGQIVPGNPNGNHPFIRIIKFPQISVAQASNLLAPEIDVDPQNPSPYLQFRGRFLDKTKINSVTAKTLWDYWNDDGRAQGFLVLNYTAQQVNSIVTVRTPIPF